MRFHHVGYAVANIRDYLDDFVIPLFNPESVSETYADPVQNVRVCFVEMQNGTTIELVEPMGKDSPVTKIVESKRTGLYHLCFEVDDLDAEIVRFRKKRCIPLSKPVPAVAFGGRRIVFLATPQNDLVELLEA